MESNLSTNMTQGAAALALREVRRGVEQREETAAGRPRELVAERVVGALRGGETTAERVELLDL